MKHFTTIILLLTFPLIAKAQKDSFWLLNLNLMGAPKAVFALDDGYSIVLADSFDQTSQQYKGIIFFKLDPNGKTVNRKQLFKLDTTYIEQRLEKAEKLNDSYLFRWYYTYYKNDSIIKSKSYFAKIDGNGEVLQNVKTMVNYVSDWKSRWILFGSDSLFYFNLSVKENSILFIEVSSNKIIDSFPMESIGYPIYSNKQFHFFYSRYLDSKPDSIWVHRTGFSTKIKSQKGKLVQERIDIVTVENNAYLYLGRSNNEITKADLNLDFLWKTPSEFVDANIRPSVKEVKVLKNGDILVIADADNSFARVPYVSRISADGKVNYFKYHYPSPLDKYYDFDEGPKGEFFLLSGSRLSQPADSVWLIKTSRFGRTNSIIEPMNDGFFSLYPNPAQYELHIVFAKPTKGHISIYSSAGSLVSEQKFGRETTMQLNIAHLPPGNYLLKVQDHKGQIYTQLFNH